MPALALPGWLAAADPPRFLVLDGSCLGFAPIAGIPPESYRLLRFDPRFADLLRRIGLSG